MIDIKFPYEKIVQAINYLIKKENGKINKMKAIKLIYFADRYHLRKYGELITNDKYYAMKYGPVPTITKDVLVLNNFLDEDVLMYAKQYLANEGEYEIRTVKEVDLDFISETEIEALEFAYKEYGTKDEFQLAKITHDYPEWINLQDQLKISKRAEMDIKHFVNDPVNKQNPCYELNNKDKEELLEEIEEKETKQAML
jgi:uncharacterized phage-associated protein